MKFSSVAPFVGALVGLAEASPAPLAPRSSGCSVPLHKSYDQAVLFNGLAPAAVKGEADVNLHIGLPVASLSGEVDVSLGADFLLAPTLRVDLSGLEANVELALSADASVYEAIELVSSLGLSLDIPGVADVTAGLGLALDLIVSVNASIDLSAGFYLSFPEGSFVEIDLLTSSVKDHQLVGLVAHALPITAELDVELCVDVEVAIGLRLRTEVALSADVDPLGLPLLSTGADVAVWVNLFDYTAIILGCGGSSSDTCAAPVTEAFALDIGIIVDVDVEVLDVLDIELDLAPTVSLVLIAATPATGCLGTPTATGTVGTATSAATPSSWNAITRPAVPTTLSSVVSSALSSGLITSAPLSSAPAPTGAPNYNETTSTITETSLVTITSCAASVVNCPASYTQKVVTSVVYSRTTVCPVTAATPVGTGSVTAPATVPATTFAVPTGAKTVVFSSVESPVSSTFTPPASSKVVDTPTVVLCPTESTASATVPATIATGTAPSVPLVTAPATSGSGSGSNSTVPVVKPKYSSAKNGSVSSAVWTPSTPAKTSAAVVPLTTAPAASSPSYGSNQTVVTAGAASSQVHFGAAVALVAGAVFLL